MLRDTPFRMRVAMLLHKSVEHDSRVRREARALVEAGHEVTVLHLPRARGAQDGQLDGFTVRSVTPSPSLRRAAPPLHRVASLFAFVTALRRLRPDAVHAHDVAMLAPGWAGARLTGARLVYDTHEYAAGVPYRERAWASLVTTIERLLIRRCDAVITVSDGIADRLQSDHRLPVRPTAVRNIPDPGAYDQHFQAPDLRAQLGIDANTPLILHLGAVAQDRGGETLVRAMAHLPEAHLLFLGAEDGEHTANLRRLATEQGVDTRVSFHPPVPVAHVPAYARQADIGVSLLQDTCENHRLALPNKVFECLHAGIPVVTADLPELRALVERHALGRLARPDDPHDVARALREVLATPDELTAAVERAREELSWEAERGHLVDVYGDPDGAPAPTRAMVLVRNPVTHDARIIREARLLDDLGYEVRIVGAAAAASDEGDDLVGGIPVRRLHARLPLGPLRRLARLASGPAEPPRESGSAESQGGSGPAEPPREGGSAHSQGGSAEPPWSPPAQTWTRRLYRTLLTADWYRRAIAEVNRTRPPLVHCNDYNTMWAGMAAKARYGARVVYDAHELWPDRNLRPEWRPWLLACEAIFTRVADRTITTSPGYAQVMARRYRIPEPLVIRNIPDIPPTPPTEPNGRPLAVYFGALTSGRGLEDAVAALAELPDLRLRIVGPEAWGFRSKLAAQAADLGVEDRLELLDPVDPSEAPEIMRDAHVGLALIQPTCLSYRLTLPNKLFEYTLAGIPVLATELPAIEQFVTEHAVGITVPPGDRLALVGALQKVLDTGTNAKLRGAVTTAQAELNGQSKSAFLRNAYETLMS